MGTYLNCGEALDTLLSAQTLVLLIIAVHSVGRDQGVQAKGSLAVFWSEPLTVLTHFERIRKAEMNEKHLRHTMVLQMRLLG